MQEPITEERKKREGQRIVLKKMLSVIEKWKKIMVITRDQSLKRNIKNPIEIKGQVTTLRGNLADKSQLIIINCAC